MGTSSLNRDVSRRVTFTLAPVRRLIVLAFIWGWSFLFIKVAVEGMTPATVAWARVALGAAVMLVVLRARRVALPRRSDRSSWRHLVVLAVTYNAVPFTLLAWGEQHISSALAAVLNASTPLFAALFTATLLGERLRSAQLAGLLLGFVGVAVAAGIGGDDFAGSSLWGELAVIALSACYGFSFTYAQRHLATISPVVAAGGQLLAATAILLPLAAITTAIDGIQLTPTRVISIALLGAVGTGIAYLLNYRSIAELGSTKASVVTYLIPVVAVAVGVVFLDEAFEPGLVFGGALTIAGIAMVHGRLARPRAGVAAIDR
jgi:drug/metabolite transporter (DMT)-like permease